MNYGIIRLSTNPVGATVYVHGQGNKGTTPIDIVNVMPGIYNITLSYSGLESYNFDMVVMDGKMTIVRFDFIVQEVTEEHIALTGTDLVLVPVPPGLPEEQMPDMPSILPPGMPVTTTESRILEAQAETNRILEKIYSNLNTSLQYTAKLSGFDTNERYFIQDTTAITVATPNQPESADIIANSTTVPVIPGYDRIPVSQVLNRNARTITVTNDGTVPLYVITSSDGIKWNRDEIPIFEGEYKRFFNIYELRIRASKIGILNRNVTIGTTVVTAFSYGGIYRVTEFETENAIHNVNRTAIFIETFPNTPVVGVGIVTFAVIDDMINTSTAFRSAVTNTDVVYTSYAGGTITDPTERITLNPGDTFRVFITKGATVVFAGASAGQTIELLQESDII